MIVGDWLARRADLTPGKVALVDTLHNNKEITYQEWNLTANQTANYFKDRFGIQKGDRVAVLAMNSSEYLDVWFALGKIGGVLQNLNWRLSSRELVELLRDAAPRVLIYSDEFAGNVRDIRASVPGLDHYIALGDLVHSGDSLFAERIKYPQSPPKSIALEWNDPWVICYTGGTTGTPKGAVLTHRSITANAVNTVISWGLTPDDVTILNSPLFHTGGLNVFTAPLVYIGGTSIVCRDFDLEQTYKLLLDGQVTVWFGVPTMFILMQNHPRWESADFSHLKLLISGGAPCPMPVFEKFWGKGVDFKTGYGLTEAGPNTFWLPPELVRSKPGAVGFPLFHIDVQAVNPDGTQCAPGEIGELVIRGPHMCAGYYKKPQETRAAIHPLACDQEGPDWLFTGDLARRDTDGCFYIVGRSKDMFISGGENVFPSEIESVLHAHPCVAEAAVIAVPHGKWGEVGRAIIVCKPGTELDAESLLGYLRDNLARYKLPKSVIFVESLPKTGANKVDKVRLKHLYG